MIVINKRPEPEEWKAKRLTPGFVYEAIPELRQALLKEQGYICAYCMRKIPVKDKTESETSKIEHIKSREQGKKEQDKSELDYDNMVICCPGNINGEAHCDKSKGSSSIKIPIFNAALQNSISYSSKDGELKSSNTTWNDEINQILCLNNSILKLNRSQTLTGIIEIITKRKWKKAELENKLTEWAEFDGKKEEFRKPYCGIVIWFLQKKLHQMN